MPIPLDGRIFWTGFAGAIPANWSRDDDFNDRFLQGTTSAADDAGDIGDASHKHTVSSGHTHPSSTHTHNATITGAATNPVTLAAAKVTVVAGSHTHLDKPTNPGTIVESSETTPTGTTTVSGTIPESRTVLVLKPDDALQDIPSSIILFALSDTLSFLVDNPQWFKIAGWVYSIYDAVFMQTADTGDNGGIIVAPVTHKHMMDAHTHTVGSHGHAGSQFGAANTVDIGLSGFGVATLLNVSHHTYFGTGSTAVTVSSSNQNTNSQAGHPAYIKWIGIYNDTGSAETPDGIIIAYVGKVADLPSGWEVVDQAGDRQILVTNVDADLGDTYAGDLESHTHIANHFHATAAHNHTVGPTHAFFSVTGNIAMVGVSAQRSASHSHTSFDIDSQSPNLTAAASTLGNSDGRYLFKKVLFIKKVDPVTVHIRGKTDIKGGSAGDIVHIK